MRLWDILWQPFGTKYFNDLERLAFRYQLFNVKNLRKFEKNIIRSLPKERRSLRKNSNFLTVLVRTYCKFHLRFVHFC